VISYNDLEFFLKHDGERERLIEKENHGELSPEEAERLEEMFEQTYKISSQLGAR